MKDNQIITMNGQQNSSNSLIDRVIGFITERKKKVERGDINCILLPFIRFRSELVGIEQGNYYLVSGLTKSAKSQITNYLFVYNTIFYAIDNPDKISIKIFYYPLEETPESITLRFMSFLLFKLSNQRIRISPVDLKSTNSNKPLDDEILDLLKSDEYQRYMKFFEEHVSFMSDRNPTGIWKTAKAYADSNGTSHYKSIKYINKDTGIEEERKAFDYYVPNDPKEYVFILVDHVSLLENERGMTLRETINKLSEYMIILRNKYNYIPVVVQQQSTETGNLDAYKAGKIRPTMAGLSDSKYTAKDCTVMLGITNPYSFEIPEYLGYNIQKLKGNARFLEVVLNRNGQSNGICPLYFDGATNFFNELPLPSDVTGLDKVYKYMDSLKKRANTSFMLINNKRKNLFNWIGLFNFANK